FSSRRRHTRSKRDWSSDVCSSDLPCRPGIAPMLRSAKSNQSPEVLYGRILAKDTRHAGFIYGRRVRAARKNNVNTLCSLGLRAQIGRASGREGGESEEGEEPVEGR